MFMELVQTHKIFSPGAGIKSGAMESETSATVLTWSWSCLGKHAAKKLPRIQVDDKHQARLTSMVGAKSFLIEQAGSSEGRQNNLTKWPPLNGYPFPLTLILLFTTTPIFANSVNPDQMASEEAI